MLGLKIFRKAMRWAAAGAAMLVGVGVAAGLAAPFVNPGEVRSGTLLLKAQEKGRFVAAPLVATDVDVAVSGPTARTRLTQHFVNPTDGWIEGVYLFPMPENSAVDSITMVIGERVIVGEIKERQKAREIFETAKAEGKKASLVEQNRPNMFTNSVANIGPRETVIVQIEYQEAVRQSGGQFSLRVPLVVAPRFTPAPMVQTVDLDGGWGRPAQARPDAVPPDAPVLDPRTNAPTNPVSLKVRLQAGFPLGEVTSHHHPVLIETVSDDTSIVKLDGPVPADRDFELTWQAKGIAPQAGLFRESAPSGDYLLAFVTPPALPAAAAPSPRDIIFVIDNSGSMGGASIQQAKASLLYALGRLTPQDRFNVVRFDDILEVLFPGVVDGDAENIGKAKAFVAALEASGGTVMAPAMRAALADEGGDPGRLRQVVFLTDGAIGDESNLFEFLASQLGRSRLFMVGIGSAPNAYLMSRAAEIGRGSYTHIGSTAQVEERMRALFAKLEKPAVTNLSVSFSERGADVSPKVLPDLYAGEPLTIAAKVASPGGDVTVSGMIGAQPWTVTMPVGKAAEGAGIAKYWARARISDAEAAFLLGAISRGEADRRILALGLDHGLLTRVTSLVAVDKTPSRPLGARLSRADVPLNLPAGWDFDKLFGAPRGAGDRPAGERPQAPGNAPLLQDASLSEAIAVANHPTSATAKVASQPTTGVVLPKTATNAGAMIWRGVLMLIVSVVLALVALAASRHSGVNG